MAAHVQKRPQHAILGTGHDDGYAEMIMGHEIASLGQIGHMAYDDRKVAEKRVDLGFVLVGVGIFGGGVIHDLGHHMGGAFLCDAQRFLDQMAFFGGNGHVTPLYNLLSAALPLGRRFRDASHFPHPALRSKRFSTLWHHRAYLGKNQSWRCGSYLRG